MRRGIQFLGISIVVLFLIPSFTSNEINERRGKLLGKAEIIEGKEEIGTCMNKNLPPIFFHHNILSIIFFTLFSNFKEKVSLLNDQIDQSQEKGSGYYTVYGGKWFAQSFIPQKYGKVTAIEILVSRHKKSILNNKLRKLPCSDKSNMDELGDITISIRESLNGENLTSKTLHPEDIPENTDGIWVKFDFSHNYPDSGAKVWLHETYYIILKAEGGDENNYYTWYYGGDNPYSNGIAYFNYGDGWTQLSDKDFCFRTYGELTFEEPDGVTERWAVIFSQFNSDPNVKFVKECLLNHGWEEDHIKMLNNEPTYNDIMSAILWVDQMDDQDDILFLCSNSHGFRGGIALANENLYYESLDRLLDNCGARIFYSISACHSGSAIPILGKRGRVIVTACKDYETGATAWFLVFLYYEGDLAGYYGYVGAPSPNGAFARIDRDLNKDGWISAEEAFPYAKEWTERFHNYYWNSAHPIHPQIYDGWNGQLLITQI